MMIEVFHHSEPGGHIQNEDCCCMAPLPGEPECHLCVIADGQGGQPGGAAAAQLACNNARDAILETSRPKLQVSSHWAKLLHQIDIDVAHDPQAGFTTLVAFCISTNWICGASS